MIMERCVFAEFQAVQIKGISCIQNTEINF